MLRFTPTAWAKLLHFRDKTENEVGGFAVTPADDLLLVTEFITVKQEVTTVSVRFDDEAVADFFEQQVDLGRKPEQFARTWLHTHPMDSPEPSITDEETFERAFGSCQWAILFVLAQNNRTYAKLRFNVGPGGHILIPVEIDYSHDFGASNQELWDSEYSANVKAEDWLGNRATEHSIGVTRDPFGSAMPYDFIAELECLDPVQRQLILDELADRPDLWDEEEVMYI